MEILIQGIKPEEWYYEGTCGTCQTKVRFQEKEAKKYDDQRDGSYICVGCPTCRSTIYGKFVSKTKPLSPISTQRDMAVAYDR